MHPRAGTPPASTSASVTPSGSVPHTCSPSLMSRSVAKSRSGFDVRFAIDAKNSAICLACSVTITLPPSCRARLPCAPASAGSDGGSPPNCTSCSSIPWAESCYFNGRQHEQEGVGMFLHRAVRERFPRLVAVPGYLRTHPQTCQNASASAHFIPKCTLSHVTERAKKASGNELFTTGCPSPSLVRV